MWQTFTREEAMSQRWIEGTAFTKTFPWRLKSQFVFCQENTQQLRLSPDSKFTDQSTSSVAAEESHWASFPTTQKIWLDDTSFALSPFQKRKSILGQCLESYKVELGKFPVPQLPPTIKMLRIRTGDLDQWRSMYLACPGLWTPTSTPGVGEDKN